MKIDVPKIPIGIKMPDNFIMPCPFCGGEGRLNEFEMYYNQVHCINPKCNVNPETRFYETEGDAIRAWNTRVCDSSSVDILTRLAEMFNCEKENC